MSFIEQLRKNAAPKGKTIVFPEGTEKRTLEAVAHILAGNIVKPILLGSEAQIMQLAAELGTSLAGAQIIDPQTAPQAAEYADAYFQLRQHKGISREDARNAVENPLFFAAFLVRNGIADGAVAGAENTTGDVMKAAIQVVGLAKNMSVVSSSFLMMMPDGQILTFADCAVVPDPNPEQLASIAAAAAGTHEKLTAEKPKIALLSFSTMGSAKHPLADKVIAAKAIAARIFRTSISMAKCNLMRLLYRPLARKRHQTVRLPEKPMSLFFLILMPEISVTSWFKDWLKQKPLDRLYRGWQSRIMT
jgi:phosphate acetyltransferase